MDAGAGQAVREALSLLSGATEHGNGHGSNVGRIRHGNTPRRCGNRFDPNRTRRRAGHDEAHPSPDLSYLPRVLSRRRHDKSEWRAAGAVQTKLAGHRRFLRNVAGPEMHRRADARSCRSVTPNRSSYYRARFVTALRAAGRLVAVVRFTAAFLATVRFTALTFFAAVFLAGAFFATVFFAAALFAGAFFAAAFFRGAVMPCLLVGNRCRTIVISGRCDALQRQYATPSCLLAVVERHFVLHACGTR